MPATIPAMGPRRLAALGAVAALLVGACGGTTTSTTAPSVAAPSVAASSPAPAGSATPEGSASASASAAAAACGTYAGPPVKLTYAMWGDATELANQQKIVDAFTALNPNITVNVSAADWESYWPKLQTDLAGGNAPDMFLMDGPLFPDYQTRDQLLDLDPYIAKDNFDLGSIVDLAVQDFTAPDGHHYGLPRDLNTIALFYNKTMFDAAGLPYPDDTWDWNKLVEVATKLTKPSGGGTPQWGFYTETSDMENYWSSLVWQAGGDILSPDKQTVVIDTDQAAAGIQFLQDLIYKHKVMPQPVPGGGSDLFEEGQAAMEANGSWLVPTHEAAGIDFGVAPLPKGPAGQATSVNPSGVVAYKGTKSPDAVWEFIKCYTGPELQAMVASLKASMPANKQILTDQYATSFDGGKTFADSRSRMRTSSRRSRATTSSPPRSRGSSTRRSSTTTRCPRRPRSTRSRRSCRSSSASEAGSHRHGWRGPGVTSTPAVEDAVRAVSRPTSRARSGRGPRSHEGRWVVLFLAPTLIGLAVLSAGPILATLGISLTKWDLLTAPQFVGLDNYARLLDDDRFLTALRNTAFYTVVSVPLGLTLALGLALALDRQIRGIAWIRTAYFLPLVTSATAIALVWLWIYSPTGPLNDILEAFGIPPQRWVSNPTLAMPSIIAMSVWQGLPANTIIFLAGLQGIPSEYYDAASVDGAGRGARFRKVTLPLLTPSIFFTGVLALIGAFQVFDQVYVMANPGKPGSATITLVYFIYEAGFRNFRMGYAAAASWIMFIIVAVATILYFRTQDRWVHYQ